jgi:hypothetical protein
MPPSGSDFRFGIPDMDQDPEKWNEGCELLMSVAPDSFGSRSRSLMIIEELAQNEEHLQEFYNNHRDRVSDLCAVQRDLTREGLASFVKKDLEKTWLELGALTRQSHMLEGLVRACSILGGKYDRLCCHELTFDGLENGDGQSFIALLKSCMPQDVSSSPSTPILLPSSKWTFTPSPTDPDNWKEETAYASLTLSRTFFICELHNRSSILQSAQRDFF